MLPTGTVTFLFTDIEGSTRLLQSLGDGYASLLGDHDRVIREAVSAAGGIEVRTAGDSFFCVFTSAAAAVNAAIAAQRALLSHAWPGDPVRVRMGLHTGEGVLGGDNYVGLDVHRAARIADAAHGGQILVSEATRALVAAGLPGVTLRSLGSHRLRDLSEPESVYQVEAPGLPVDFPPIRTVDHQPNNLPLNLTVLHGREEEAERAKQLLATSRLLTLTGPGGTGKTRLSLHLASELIDSFPDGVWFVDLSPLTDPELVPSAIAVALGVRHTGPPLGAVVNHLAGKSMLIVLDNFEQVIDAAVVVSELLAASSGVKVIVTSRGPLRISGEQEFPVPPLPVPALGNGHDPSALGRVPSVALFVERARAVQPDFALTDDNAAAVAGLVARLDGLPLALELAAARVRILSPAGILERLGGASLQLLASRARDRSARQQTLRDTIAWSHELLADDARRLFRRLAVFAGGADLEQVEEVAGEGTDVLDAVAELLDQGLVRREEGQGRDRVRMLETIREYALERLREAGEEPEYRTRHADAYLALAQRSAPHLTGWDRRVWLDQLDLENDNLRSALSWVIDAGDAERAMRLSAALWRFWHMRGHLHEAGERMPAVLAMPGAAPETRAVALEAAGGLAHWRGDWKLAFTYYDEALRIVEQIGDERAIANALYNRVFGWFDTFMAGDSAAAKADARRSLEISERLGDRAGMAKALWAMGIVQQAVDGDREALASFLAATELFRELDDSFGLGWGLFEVGQAERRLGDLVSARRHLEEATEIFAEVGDVSGIVLHLVALARLAADEGDREKATRLAGAVAALRESSGTLLADSVEGAWNDLSETFRSLDPATVSALQAEGRAMSVAEALAYAREPVRGKASSGS